METLDYYNNHAEEFCRETKYVVFKEVQDRFLSYLKSGGAVLDIGCGSGRDVKYFKDRGYRTEALDGSKAVCEIAENFTGIPVRCQRFEEFYDKDRYDGVWACASLLHLKYQELITVLRRIHDALREEGILYASFKYGKFEGMRKGRYFLDMDEEKLTEVLNKAGCFTTEDLFITNDIRKEREEEKWLNIILRRDCRNRIQ